MKGVAGKENQQGEAADEEVRFGTGPAQADAEGQEVGVAEQQDGAVSESVVQTDLPELAHAILLCTGDETEEEVDEGHCGRQEEGPEVFSQLSVDASVHAPVNRNPVGKVIVREGSDDEGQKDC